LKLQRKKAIMKPQSIFVKIEHLSFKEDEFARRDKAVGMSL
jgi:hypothetical protein